MQDKTDHGMNRDKASTGAPGPCLLSDEILKFLESGVSVIVAVVGADGRAQTGRALASRVVADGTIRLIYQEEGNAAVAASAQSGGPIAVTFSAPLSHRTIQIKGTSCKAEQLEPEDGICAEHQSEAFSIILCAIGYAPAFANAICNHRSSKLSVLSFSAQAAFEQTPGPGAGREI